MSKAVHTSMALALVGGLFIMVFGLLTSRPSLELLGVPEEIMDDALTYLNVYYAGIIASMIYNVGTGVLRAIGDSRMPLYVLIVCCLVNIVLDLLFVLAFHWDVFGVAFATVLSQVVSAVLIMLRLMLTRESYRVELKKIRFDRSILKKRDPHRPAGGAAVGAVLHLQPGGAGLHQLLRHRRHRLLGGHRQDRRLYLDGDERLRHRHHHLCGAELRGPEVRPGQAEHQGLPGGWPWAPPSPCPFCSCVFMEPLLRFFTGDEAVIEIGQRFFWVLAPSYFTYVFIEILSGAIRGAGEAFQPMLITCFGVCGLRILWLTIVVNIWHTMEMVAMNYPVTWVIAAVVFIIYYCRMNWAAPVHPPGGG